MHTPLEHDYIGLTDVIPSMESSEKLSSSTISSDNTSEKDTLNLKATELTLGLPGSHQTRKTAPIFDHRQFEIVKDDKNVYPFGVIKSLVSGAKRGFCDTVDIGGSGQWGFNGNGGSDGDLVKNGGLFSPRAKNGENHVIGSDLLGFVMPVAAAAKDAGVKNTVAAQEKMAGPASKAQVVGWPPIRSFRKNTMATNLTKNDDILEGKLESRSLYVKVSMDGAPYLRKLDLQTCHSYLELSAVLEKMFSCFTIGKCGLDGVPNPDVIRESRRMDLLHGSEYVLTFEDKDGDWMLVGDVPWKMFTETCKRLRIMKSSEAIGLAPKPMEKRNNLN